jgi:ribosome biogenesis GTPase
VIANHGKALTVEDADGGLHRCVARRRLDRAVSGDRVLWQPDSRGHGVVAGILPRRSLLARPDERGHTRPIAANLDQIIMVIAARPTFQEALIDRYLVAAEFSRIAPVILLNKVDLLDPPGVAAEKARVEPYSALGYAVRLSSAKQTDGLGSLAQQIQGRTSILVGQSGVGKSSLVKRLLPEAAVTVGALSGHAPVGRHTTTATTLYHLPGGTDIIDSPGVRDFGVWHIPAERIAEGFVEFRPCLGRCRFRDCSHHQEPDCAVRAAVQEGLISARRYASYQAIMAELHA